MIQEVTCSFLFPDNKILLALSRCEPEPLLALGLRQSSLSSPPSSSSSSVTSTESDNAKYKIISTLSDFYDRELVGTIGWAKQIPGKRSQSLPGSRLIVLSRMIHDFKI